MIRVYVPEVKLEPGKILDIITVTIKDGKPTGCYHPLPPANISLTSDEIHIILLTNNRELKDSPDPLKEVIERCKSIDLDNIDASILSDPVLANVPIVITFLLVHLTLLGRIRAVLYIEGTNTAYVIKGTDECIHIDKDTPQVEKINCNVTKVQMDGLSDMIYTLSAKTSLDLLKAIPSGGPREQIVGAISAIIVGSIVLVREVFSIMEEQGCIPYNMARAWSILISGIASPYQITTPEHIVEITRYILNLYKSIIQKLR